MNDPYKTLGVKKNSSSAEIKSAYRSLAKKHHPDLNAGNAELFKSISGAYDVLSDKTKRDKYDRGEFDIESKAQKPGPGFWRNWSDGSRTNGRSNASHSFDFDQFDGAGADILSDIFKRNSNLNGSMSQNNRSQKKSEISKNTNYKLKVPFIEATLGIKKKVTLSDGKTVNMLIPMGTETGTKLRLKGQGKTITGSSIKSDAVVEVTVEDHAYFVRRGQDIHVEIPVAIHEAVLGAAILVPTIHGNVTLKIPSNSNYGTTLRLKGKGISKVKELLSGDQYVSLCISLPEKIDAKLGKFIKKWSENNKYNPRKNMELD
jgi:DnaJ-class molecular chaperone